MGDAVSEHGMTNQKSDIFTSVIAGLDPQSPDLAMQINEPMAVL